MSKDSTGMTTGAEGAVADDMTTMTAAASVAEAAEVTRAEGDVSEAVGSGGASDDAADLDSITQMAPAEATDNTATMTVAVVDADATEVASTEGDESEGSVAVDSGEGVSLVQDLTIAASVADATEVASAETPGLATLEGEVTPGISAITTDLGDGLTAEELAAAIAARLSLQRSVSLFVEMSNTAPNSPAGQVDGESEGIAAPRFTLGEDEITDIAPASAASPAQVVMAASAEEGSSDDSDAQEEGDTVANMLSDIGVVVDTPGVDLAGAMASSSDADATA